MQLTSENYYSQEANREYMSVSGYKDFAGTYGKLPCEFHAMEKLNGNWEDEKTTALLVGSYVDSYFEGSLEQFKKDNKEIFTQKGDLNSDYKQAENIIARIERDKYFMKYMSGQKQVIMTGELFGTKWKIKMDSYIPGVAIVDLKVMASITKLEWVKDIGYLDFVRYWGYDIQGAVYQEIVRQNTGEKLPFFIAGATKEKPEPDIRIIHVTDNYLQEALHMVEMNMPRIPGQPFGKQRPKFSRAGAYVKTYTPKETTSYENLVKLFYNEAAKGKMFPEGAMLDVRIIAYYEIPKSTSKKKRREMLEHRIRPTKKPDWDNIGKIVCDSLNLVAYHDDSAVVDAQVRKFYSETPRVDVMIKVVGPDQI